MSNKTNSRDRHCRPNGADPGRLPGIITGVERRLDIMDIEPDILLTGVIAIFSVWVGYRLTFSADIKAKKDNYERVSSAVKLEISRNISALNNFWTLIEEKYVSEVPFDYDPNEFLKKWSFSLWESFINTSVLALQTDQFKKAYMLYDNLSEIKELCVKRKVISSDMYLPEETDFYIKLKQLISDSKILAKSLLRSL